jgi:hypothetical protein
VKIVYKKIMDTPKLPRKNLTDIWFKSMNQFSEHSYSHIGTEEQLRAVCDEYGKKWLAGTKLCRELYVN